jgi:hypothetical protein
MPFLIVLIFVFLLVGGSRNSDGGGGCCGCLLGIIALVIFLALIGKLVGLVH